MALVAAVLHDRRRPLPQGTLAVGKEVPKRPVHNRRLADPLRLGLLLDPLDPLDRHMPGLTAGLPESTRRILRARHHAATSSRSVVMSRSAASVWGLRSTLGVPPRGNTVGGPRWTGTTCCRVRCSWRVLRGMPRRRAMSRWERPCSRSLRRGSSATSRRLGPLRVRSLRRHPFSGPPGATPAHRVRSTWTRSGWTPRGLP
jgi:hypothetical protein